MQVVIHTTAAHRAFQTLDREWYGLAVSPAFSFRFELTEQGLLFTARREAGAVVHPEAREGCFHENLWQYDTAEFFLAKPDCSRYLEFNLNPKGAWWCRVFRAPRVADETMADFMPAVQAKGCLGAGAWTCEALLPHAALQQLGIDPACCRLAATAILGTPGQLFLTTAADVSGEPDFHRPSAWEMAVLG